MKLRDRLRSPKLQRCEVSVGDLRLTVQGTEDLLDPARAAAMKYFEQIETYIRAHPAFKTTSVPHPAAHDAPELVEEMAQATEVAKVGPMVALPGAFVEFVARDLQAFSKEVVVSCEGDAFVVSRRPRTFTVEPSRGDDGGVAVKVKAQEPYAFFTSFGRLRIEPVIGKARAVGVLADHGAVADSVGSAMGLALHRPQDVERALEVCRKSSGVKGAVIVAGGRIGVWGDIEIASPK